VPQALKQGIAYRSAAVAITTAAAITEAIATAISGAMVAAGAGCCVQPRSCDGGLCHRGQREGDQAEYELQFRFHV